MINITKKDWKFLEEGSEAKTYTDGKFAYRLSYVANKTLEQAQKEFEWLIGKSFRNVVKVFDIWQEDKFLVIKMELLQPIDFSIVSDKIELNKISTEICEAEDMILNLLPIIETIGDIELKRMVQSIYDAGIQLDYLDKKLDIGFHNLMFDPVSGEYKQIDLF